MQKLFFKFFFFFSKNVIYSKFLISIKGEGSNSKRKTDRHNKFHKNNSVGSESGAKVCNKYLFFYHRFRFLCLIVHV